MMFRKFTTADGREIWLNIDWVEQIRDAGNEKEKCSRIYMHGDACTVAYTVKGTAEEIVNGIYNSKWRWDGNRGR